MKKYEKYKPTNIDWIGDIPEHWEVKKIKHNCYVKARVGWKGLKSDEFLSEGYSYLVTGQDFKNDVVNWKECYFVDKDRYEDDPYIQLVEDDLLITKDGTIGKLAIVKNIDKPACLNSGIFVVRSLNNSLKTDFLFWIIKSKIFTQFNDFTSYGSTIQHLYQNVFVEFSHPLPKENEQTFIANYLYKKTQEIDQLIEDKKQLLQLFEEEKKAITSQAVTKGLNPKTEFRNSGIEWIGNIPKHWKLKKLKYLGKVQTGRTPKIQSSKIDYFENGKINWFTPSDFKSNKEVFKSKRRIIEEAVHQNEVELFPENSIYLVSIGATLGKISYCSEKASANQQINVISFYQEICNSMYGYFYLIACKDILLLEADYTTLPILNQSKTKNLDFAVPPIEEQKLIVDFIQKETKIIDSKIKKIKKLIDLLTEYRSTLISDVVTGKINVIE